MVNISGGNINGSTLSWLIAKPRNTDAARFSHILVKKAAHAATVRLSLPARARRRDCVGRVGTHHYPETGQRFGASHIIDVLRGADTEKIRQFRHKRVSSYGAGATEDKNNLGIYPSTNDRASGYLHMDVTGYGGLQLTKNGIVLLREGGRFLFRRVRRSDPNLCCRKFMSARRWRING